MTNQEKEFLCHVLSAFFYPPDQELAERVNQGAVRNFFQKTVQSLKGIEGLLRGFQMEGTSDTILQEMKGAYERLFSGVNGRGISLVESSYKPWTEDSHCPLPFASEKGLLMGDSAQHLREVYRHCRLEISEEFRSAPDHLCMELDFLSFLYQRANDAHIKRFLEDHLDWLPLLKDELDRVRPHPFYRGLTGILILLVDRERERLEGDGNGKKDVDSRPSVCSGVRRAVSCHGLLET